MTSALVNLGENDLRELAAALRTGRLTPPFTALAIQRLVTQHAVLDTATSLQDLHNQGLNGSQISTALELLLQDRRKRSDPGDLIDLVVTGPEGGAVAVRDTRVVVRELFANASESVLVAGYAVYKGQQVFQSLADRMMVLPELKVRLFLDITRRYGDTTIAADLVQRFLSRFKQSEWPVDRPMPEVYYFPLSQEHSPESRAVLHAKCIVIDRQQVFVGSANFTEAAHNRNIEVGLLIKTSSIAHQLASHFEALVADGELKRVL